MCTYKNTAVEQHRAGNRVRKERWKTSVKPLLAALTHTQLPAEVAKERCLQEFGVVSQSMREDHTETYLGKLEASMEDNGGQQHREENVRIEREHVRDFV